MTTAPAISPSASAAACSPGFDANGNSSLGALALEKLAKRKGWSAFGG